MRLIPLQPNLNLRKLDGGIAESLLDESNLPVDNVRRTLALLETLGLVARVNVPAAPTGAALFYVPMYRVPAPDDDSRDDDLGALEAAFPGLAT